MLSYIFNLIIAFSFNCCRNNCVWTKDSLSVQNRKWFVCRIWVDLDNWSSVISFPQLKYLLLHFTRHFIHFLQADSFDTGQQLVCLKNVPFTYWLRHKVNAMRHPTMTKLHKKIGLWDNTVSHHDIVDVIK